MKVLSKNEENAFYWILEKLLISEVHLLKTQQGMEAAGWY